MPLNDSFEFDYVPGYTKPTHEHGTPFGDEFHAERVDELLASMVAYRQRGVTLAGGQGVLPTGAVIARQTANGKYYIVAPAASDGTQTPLGLLRNGRDTGGTGSPSGKVSTDALGNLVYSGAVFLALISGTDTTSLVGGAAGGFGSGATGAYTLLKGRLDLGFPGANPGPGGNGAYIF
jgi:hypothetical protein